MKRAIRHKVCVVFAAGALLGQAPVALPKFDIADVHASPKGENTYMSGGLLRGGRYDLHNATMVDLIQVAYGVDDNRKVVGGPGWMDMDRFDIVAKAPPSTSFETVNLMLQDLLADRFKLVVHKDTKPMPVFALSLGKGKPKMKESKEAKESDDGKNQGCLTVLQDRAADEVPYNMRSCYAVTMDELAGLLPRMAGAYLSGRPLINQTGLEGAWDFDFKWTSRAQLTVAGPNAITIAEAIDKQLGLKLESTSLPMAVIVVDSANQKPTENPAGVTSKIPPPPAEFEVASIRASSPDEQLIERLASGRVDFRAIALKELIKFAWNINSDDRLVDMPKFVDSAKFDIVGKTGPAIDFEDVRVMMRALLAGRFKLATHMEERTINAYVLTAVKPKLKKADPANRSGCNNGPGPDGKDPREANPVNARLETCLNTTMAQLAEALQNFGSGYIQTSVLNETGIEGAYDFTLNFATAVVFRRAQTAGADPNGAISLFEAVNKQLGLKLEQQKRPAQVLVVDHVEEKPTDN